MRISFPWNVRRASHTTFCPGTQVGIIDASLIVRPSTLYVDTPEGTLFSATPVILNADTKYYGSTSPIRSIFAHLSRSP